MKYVNKISIITLTYNNWRLLGAAIKSLACQVLSDNYEVEYILVDDGTVDLDIKYVKDLLSTLNNTRFKYYLNINEKNIGTVASFNNAIKKSTGDLIIPLAADDEFYDRNVVSTIIKEFNNNKHYLLTALRVPMICGKEKAELPKRKYWNYFSSREKLYEKILFSGNIISGASTYYHRSVFNEVGLFDEKYRVIEDYPFFLKVLSNNIDIPLLKIVSVKYSTKGVSTVRGVDSDFSKDMKLLLSDVLEVNNFNFFEKRYFYYQRYLNRHEKIKVKNIVFYPEQVVLFFLKKSFHFFYWRS